MRVLLINSVSGIRSTGRICTDIADRYLNKGYDVRIAFGREQVPDKYKDISVRIGNKLDIYSAAFRVRLLDNDGFNNILSTKKFLKWADEYNPDILWLHNLHGYYINIKLLFEWIKSRPQMKVKWTLHDCWAFTGHCAHFTFAECDKWKTQCCDCCQVRSYPTSIWCDNSKNNYTKKKGLFTNVYDMEIIVPSKWLAELVGQSFLAEYPIVIQYNEIDKDVFKHRKSNFKEFHGLRDKKIALGVATAWSNKKGLSDFIQLSYLLDEQYKVVLVGVTEKQIKKLPANIVGIRRTNNAIELAEIYSAADVFVNLTYEDTYPTVNLEAQACGTPCITYRTGGSPESVPIQNVIEVGNLNKIAERIKEICCAY